MGINRTKNRHLIRDEYRTRKFFVRRDDADSHVDPLRETSKILTVARTASWKEPKLYPPLGHREPLHLAWECLRRNAEYERTVSSIHLRQPGENYNEGPPGTPEEQAATETDEQLKHERLIDSSCLKWRVSELVSPDSTWLELPKQFAIASSEPAFFYPPPDDERIAEELQMRPLSRAFVPTTSSHLVVRVSIDGNPARQARQIAAELRRLREDVELDGNKASLHNKAARFTYTQKSFAKSVSHEHPLAFPDGQLNADNTEFVLERIPVARVPFRVRRETLHFILRVLDAFSAEYPEPREFPEEVRRSGMTEQAFMLEHPLGLQTKERFHSLAGQLANHFRYELKNRGDTHPAFNEDFPDDMTAESIHDWLLIGRRYALAQGYAQIATGK